MGSEWREVKLGDVTTIDFGYPFKSEFYCQIPANYRLLRGDNIAQGTLRWEGAKFWKEIDSSISSYEMKLGDVVLAMDRPWIEAGLKYAEVKTGDLPSLLVQRVARLRAGEGVEQKFLKSIIGSKDFTDYVLSIQTGTAVPHISGSQIKDYSFSLPPFPIQRQIAAILSAFDDKIELNRQMNRTLEAMARALFKSWFVDFDPVRAKMRGKQPEGMDAQAAALFPAELVEVDGREVPKGWEIKKISDEIKRISVGKKYEQKTVKKTGKVPVLDQGKSGIIGFHDEVAGVEANNETPVIVFANHTCYMRLVNFPFSAIQNVLPFKGQNVNIFWLYFATLGAVAFSEYKGHWPEFESKEIIIPPNRITEVFGELVKTWCNLIWQNDQESAQLAQLRDVLLPRLLSGEVDVSEWENT